MVGLKERVERLKEELYGVKLVAVTKGVSDDLVRESLGCGITCIAENYADALAKRRAAFPNVELHMVGNVQSKDVRECVKNADMIQTIWRDKIALKIDRVAREAGKTMPVLIEVNVGLEETKSGLAPDAVPAFYEFARRFDHIDIRGLMCVAPYFENPEHAWPYFRQMKDLCTKLALPVLSMGMSHDYRVAIEEGSNMVRIGTLIYGERANKSKVI